jgi:amino acid adenylation domain-containing protein
LLVEWNASTAAYHRTRCIHQLFEAQVERVPDAIAVVCGDRRLTYRELNQRANRLAHRLIALGVGAEAPVGLCVERSVEMVIGLLGILKAGGAYVPLDPASPPERCATTLMDARAAVVVTQWVLRERFTAQTTLVCLDADTHLATTGEENPATRVGVDNLVYVIYTSGSTGTPRGVMVQHGALVNHATTMVATIGLRPGDRFLQFAPLSFDASGVQIFPTLISGATLVVHPAPAALSHRELLQLCEDQGISVLDLPTAFWHQWVEDMDATRTRLRTPLRFFMTGGEQPLLAVLRAWAILAEPGATFLSSYGPTEATITATTFAVANDAGQIAGLSCVPMGRPIANVAIYLLDRSLQPVPIGVPGEVYIGGAGVARGYIEQAASTAERFVPDPFGDRPGARLYRTGDLARRRPDGTLEFLGRMDHQVKIRGFRIEPAEIEAALAHHGTVRESVVLVHEAAPGVRQLVAYVVPTAGTSASGADLRDFLKEQLPGHMVLSAVIILDALPLTANGKVDRRRLPAPIFEAPGAAYVAPRDPVEDVLAGLWHAVLGVERVGVHDNFFDLGGHSLLATRLISRVRAMFQMEVPLHRLFEAPTVAGLARVLLALETTPGRVALTARLRKQIDSMSAHEVQAMLQESRTVGGKRR